MRNTSLALLIVALFALGCGGGSDGQSKMDADNQAVPASASPDNSNSVLAESPRGDKDRKSVV